MYLQSLNELKNYVDNLEVKSTEIVLVGGLSSKMKQLTDTVYTKLAIMLNI